MLQGEREMARDNRTLGKFQLDGIPPAPRGVPQIEVTFDIDANGILNVSAKDKATGKEQTIRIEASSGLSEDEIEKMVKDAEAHAEEDKERREKVETRNRADQAVYESEKRIKEMGDKLDADTRAKLEAATQRTREAVQKEDHAEIKSALADLNQLWHQASEKLYQGAKAAGPQPGDGGPEGTPGPEPEGAKRPVDADFEVVDEKKAT